MDPARKADRRAVIQREPRQVTNGNVDRRGALGGGVMSNQTVVDGGIWDCAGFVGRTAAGNTLCCASAAT